MYLLVFSRVQKVVSSGLLWIVLLAISIPTFGQAVPGTGSTSIPIPDAGHDYIQALSETVDPSSGSLSLRLAVPIPVGRKLTLPFNFAYDTNGTYIPGPILGQSFTTFTTGPLMSTGGWSYTIPAAATDEEHYYVSEEKGQVACPYYTNWRFVDESGGRHGLGMISLTGNDNPCAEGSAQAGGDIRLLASIPQSASSVQSLKVSDADGTAYYNFSSSGLVGTVEDRNGNMVLMTDLGNGAFTEVDTAGRTVVSSSGFGTTGNTLAVSGLGGNYTLGWQSTSYSYSTGWTLLQNSGTSFCTADDPVSGSLQVLQYITLPNGQQYIFEYDPTYGLLTKITYPTGATVSYQWTVNSGAVTALFPDAVNNANACLWKYGKPALYTRTVSFNGSSPVLRQTFTYNTNWPSSPGTAWTSKQTQVVTQDLVRGTSFTTTYLYGPSTSGEPTPRYMDTTVNIPDTWVPVEQAVTYSDFNGSVLETKHETWYNAQELESEQISFNGGSSSQTTYTYGSGGLVTSKYEYDFGASTPSRETITNYQTFSAMPAFGAVSLFDRPCQSIVYDGSGNRYAETDYFYDNSSTATVCGAAGTPSVSSAGGSSLTGHDETNYSATSTNARGNLTQKTRWLNTGTSSPITTYTYDETGQVSSITDPCGKGTCSDMTGTPTTVFSYSDSFLDTNATGFAITAGAPPSGKVTNAYLTAITYPATNKVAHVETGSYGYNDGKVTQFSDENKEATTYRYNDLLGRLTESDYPDGGDTSFGYDDAPPSPSITTKRLISSSLSLSTVKTMDGLGHIIQSELVSDPDGPTFTAMIYDGEGRQYQVFNPTRCATPTTNCGSETTWGYETKVYDSLGRTTQIEDQDGSIASTSYNANQMTATDEIGNQRTFQIDALGRRTYVWEAPNVTGYNYETQYQYDPLNDLTSVTQNGTNSSAARSRSFVYDSLGRLISAENPEAGTTTYTYDLNGNVVTRINPQPNQTGTAQTTTGYTYDALNRRLSITHTNPAGSNGAYAYDGAAISGCPGASVPAITSPTNLVGRRSAMCTQQSASSFSYDPMGRLALEARTNSYQNPAPITYTTGYLYYLDGSTHNITYPSGDTVTYTVGGAGRVTQISDETNNFVAAASYAPHGALASMTQGVSITTSNNYNDRLQPNLLSASTPDVSTSISYAIYNSGCSPGCTATYTVSSSVGINVGDSVTVTGNSNSILNGTFTVSAVSSGSVTVLFSDENGGKGDGGTMTDYTSGVVFSLCHDFHLSVVINTPWCYLLSHTTGDNGNVYGIYNNGDTTRSAVFAYDSLNRIAQANTINTTSANCWGESYTIDAWGNLTNIAAASGMSGNCYYESMNAAPASTANQLGGYSYDAAGNLLLNTSFYYDQENRLYNPSAPYTYFYDADGLRARKAASATEGTFYWRGSSGEVLTEANGSGTVNEEYVYFNGNRIARVDRPSGTVHYYFSDNLGSAATITSASGSVEEQYNYYPYGGLVATTGSDTNHYMFTGKERDNESGEFGLDYFGTRHYGSSFGRFITPDPIHIMKQKIADPQQWNMYSYVRNNPLRFTDPTGMYLCADSSTCSSHQDKAFERARQLDLRSKDPAVVTAAKAYGDKNTDNGVTVAFATSLPGGCAGGGGCTQPGVKGTSNGVAPDVKVTFLDRLSGHALEQAVSHEGSHAADALQFINSYDSTTGKFNGNFNYVHYDTEFKAYAIGDSVMKGHGDSYQMGTCGGSPCVFGANDSIQETYQKIDQMLTDPKSSYKNDLEKLQFDPSIYPQ
jgi:RHS repeat-associated protein